MKKAELPFHINGRGEWPRVILGFSLQRSGNAGHGGGKFAFERLWDTRGGGGFVPHRAEPDLRAVAIPAVWLQSHVICEVHMCRK